MSSSRAIPSFSTAGGRVFQPARDDVAVLQTVTAPDMPGWRVRIVELEPDWFGWMLEYQWGDNWMRSYLQQGYVNAGNDMFEAMGKAAHWLDVARQEVEKADPQKLGSRGS